MRTVFLTFLITISMLWVVSSCKKYADPPPYFEDDSTSAVVGQRKVLLIGIDGLPGKEFTALNPPTMMSMLQKGKYTFFMLEVYF